MTASGGGVQHYIFGIGWLFLSVISSAQGAAMLQTRDTVIRLETTSSAPRVIELHRPGERVWRNSTSEVLIPRCFRGTEEIPLRWKLQSSHEEAHRVFYVYESRSPHLRLMWEWRARADFGPVEHVIRIENLTGGELLLPLQDSIRFDWQVPHQVALEQWFVEKAREGRRT